MRLRLSVSLALVLAMAAAHSQTIRAAVNSPVADAARRGDKEAVKSLLKEGADVTAPQGDGMTALHWAAERGDVDLAHILIYGGANVSAVTRIGQYTALHLAARTGSAGVVKALLDGRAEASVKTSPTGVTPLHLAAGSGSVDTIALLLDAKADINAKESEWGQTPLVFAAAANRVDAIKLLMKRSADAAVATKVVDVAKDGQLDRAARQLQAKILETTVPKGQKATASQAQAAVQAAREMLLSGKAPPPESLRLASEVAGGGRDPNFNPEEINPPVTAKGGLTALHHAVRQGYLESARALIEGGAPINQPSAGDGSTPLLMAAINGQFDMAMLLVEKGADPNLSSKGNSVAPLWATINTQWQPRTRFPQPQEMELQTARYLDVMEAMLKAGADPNGRLQAHPWYMVYTGCGNRNCGLADNSGSTPFWRAAYSVDLDAMKLLAKYGADPNIPTIAPQQAVRRGGGPPPGAPDAGAPPAGAPAGALAGAAPGLVARDVGAGGAVAPTPDDGQERYSAPAVPYGGPGAFPIHAAAGVEYGEGFAGNAHRHAPAGWLPVLKYLVEELGADVNARDNDGYTPLHHAAARGDNEMILYLVSKGADPKAVARSGQTTADMANGPVQRVSPIPETVALLMKLGSKNSNKCVSC
ncbi:MAG TPA: ankyrin repeat domain-containing protein [Vicinamibacterales bacterium]|nr:ankyrin repeat domain-containing protein [Vicinamibacterales bacterium]